MTTDNAEMAAAAELRKLLDQGGVLHIITSLPNPDCTHGDATRPSFNLCHAVEKIEEVRPGMLRATSVEYEAPAGSRREGETVRDWTEGKPVALLARLQEVVNEAPISAPAAGDVIVSPPAPIAETPADSEEATDTD